MSEMKFVKFKELFGDKTVYLPYNKKGEENNVSKQEPWSGWWQIKPIRMILQVGALQAAFTLTLSLQGLITIVLRGAKKLQSFEEA